MSHVDNATLTIRGADAADIRIIKTLAHAIWPDAYGRLQAEEKINYLLELFYTEEALARQMKEGQKFIVAELNGEPVGFASYSGPTKSGVFRIHKLYVHQAVQGKGLGRQLLDHIFTAIAPFHPTAVELGVYRKNPAIKFYENYGFSIDRSEDTDVGSGFVMTDYIMVKSP